MGSCGGLGKGLKKERAEKGKEQVTASSFFVCVFFFFINKKNIIFNALPGL